MRHISLAALVFIATPAIAASETKKEARCEAQSQIVQHAKDMRGKRKSEKKTREFLMGPDSPVEAKYRAATPMLVAWVYELKRKDLKRDVAGAFRQTCNRFDP